MTRWSARRWLARFEAVGGIVGLTASKSGTVELLAGWRVAGWSLEQQLAARVMVDELDARPRRWRAITAATAARNIALACGRRA